MERHLGTYGFLKHDFEWRAERLKETIEEQGGLHTLQLADGGEIEYEDSISYMDETDTEVAFFSIAKELITHLEEILFEQIFIEEEYRDGTILNYIGDNRRDVFHRFDILSDELKADIQLTVDFRNDLVHRLGSTQRNTTISELSDAVNAALGAVDGLENEIRERSSNGKSPLVS